MMLFCCLTMSSSDGRRINSLLSACVPEVVPGAIGSATIAPWEYGSSAKDLPDHNISKILYQLIQA